jgi:cation:H+ antiporter
VRSTIIPKISLVLAFALPSIVVRLGGMQIESLAAVAVHGAAVVAASFLLAWAAEAAQVDVSVSLATALIALIAVLPEYAVDLYFAFTSGHRFEYQAYAAANMTGSNRLLIGIGWPLVAVLFALWVRRSRPSRSTTITLPSKRRVELAFLGAASIYAFVIPLKGTLSILDAVVLLGLFAGYFWRTSQQTREEPHLHGLPADVAALPVLRRRGTVIALFLTAAVIILLAAKPFADGLVVGGRRLGIDEFLLVQWLAPLSSEAPELLIAGLLASRGNDDTALGTLLSSKVNQWTLLVGSLPIAHALGGGGAALSLDGRQIEEFLLTSAQAVLALVVLLRLRFRVRDALLLFFAFAIQLAIPNQTARYAFAFGYLALAAALLVRSRLSIAPTARALLRDEPEVA